ncbi:MAG: hypothetical protein LBF62_14830 [Tannerellaceae bacterium]|jgi:hypothetical protein|nr:hypothetical protein [Tannerellaceae bacterium]
MSKDFRFIFILLIVSTGSYAQDTIPVTGRLYIDLSPVIRFSSAANYNPGAMVYTLQQNISDLGFVYEQQTGDAGLTQTGTASDGYALRAESYTWKGKHHIWGKASYAKTHTDNIKWNESSDYYTIYPYVFADSVGGNNLAGERYSFMGGYARDMGKIAWGISLDYWALMEYRAVDPRPNNNTSNLVLNAGLNYKISGQYAVGGGFFLRKYKQDNTIKFSNSLGRKSSLHHITGLGSDAFLFANNETASLFNGKGYGANVQLLPINGKDFSATLVCEHFSFEKQLKNNQHLGISSIDEGKYLAEITYLKQTGKHTLGAKAEGAYTDRRGTEGKFTKNENNEYVKISSETQYKNLQTGAGLTFIYQHREIKSSWHAMPYISYYNTNESHKATARKMTVGKMEFGIKPGLAYVIKKHLISVNTHAGYVQNLRSGVELTGLAEDKGIFKFLMQDYDYLSSNAFLAGLSVRFDYALPKSETAVYIKGTWNYSKYEKAYSSFPGVRLGATF